MNLKGKCFLVGIILLTVFSCYTVNTAAAEELPPNAIPQEGKAYGKIPDWFGAIEITFWNVGALSNEKTYHEAVVKGICIGPFPDNVHCTDQTVTGTFTGGPNGMISLNGLTLNLKNGEYFEVTLQKTYQIPVENPDIFDSWSAPVRVDSGAQFSSLSREVEYYCPPDTIDNKKFANAKTVIYVGCHIFTGEDSSAVITFADNSTLMMKAESEIIIALPPEKPGQMEMLMGRFKVNIGKIIRGEAIELKTNLATVGIKGTRFIYEDDGKLATLKVIEGVVTIKPKNGSQTVNVNAGESITTNGSSLSAKAVIDPVKEEKMWETGFTLQSTPSATTTGSTTQAITSGSATTQPPTRAQETPATTNAPVTNTPQPGSPTGSIIATTAGNSANTPASSSGDNSPNWVVIALIAAIVIGALVVVTSVILLLKNRGKR